jgi:hypothetical protein
MERISGDSASNDLLLLCCLEKHPGAAAMVEYGLIASKTSSFLGDFFWQMKIFLGSMPLWQMIGAGVVLVALLHWLLKSR